MPASGTAHCSLRSLAPGVSLRGSKVASPPLKSPSKGAPSAEGTREVLPRYAGGVAGNNGLAKIGEVGQVDWGAGVVWRSARASGSEAQRQGDVEWLQPLHDLVEPRLGTGPV